MAFWPPAGLEEEPPPSAYCKTAATFTVQYGVLWFSSPHITGFAYIYLCRHISEKKNMHNSAQKVKYSETVTYVFTALQWP